MKKLENREKRGRPDIVHQIFLLICDSPLYLEKRVKFYIHTVNNIVLFCSQGLRPPRNYNRFVGLMEQLLVEGSVPPPPSKPLIYTEKLSVEELVKKIAPSKVIVFSSKGRLIKNILDYIDKTLKTEDNPAFIIGGFHRGDISSNILSLSNDVVSIYPKPLSCAAVTCMLLTSLYFSSRELADLNV